MFLGPGEELCTFIGGALYSLTYNTRTRLIAGKLSEITRYTRSFRCYFYNVAVFLRKYYHCV